MQVEIDEVVSTIRVTDGGAGLDPRTLERLVEAVLRAVELRGGRDRERDMATAIPDDGRGAVARQTGGAS
jgi:hypothetical protein